MTITSVPDINDTVDERKSIATQRDGHELH
jgi:hypothetical protein